MDRDFCFALLFSSLMFARCVLAVVGCRLRNKKESNAIQSPYEKSGLSG